MYIAIQMQRAEEEEYKWRVSYGHQRMLNSIYKHSGEMLLSLRQIILIIWHFSLYANKILQY